MLFVALLESSLTYMDWVVYNELGSRKIWIFLLATTIKSIRDSFVRVLLIGAAKGW